MPKTPTTTPRQARDIFLNHLIDTLPPEHLAFVLTHADRLLSLVTSTPLALNAFVLANAELAMLHAEGELAVPKIEVASDIPKSYGGTD